MSPPKTSPSSSPSPRAASSTPSPPSSTARASTPPPSARTTAASSAESADGTLAWVFLKPDDVPTYVEYGAADLGVSGRDTLLERRHDLYTPVDLGIGRCRLVVAAPRGKPIPDVPRVATKYPRVAAEHFAKRGVQAEVIPVHGSVELAPLVGLADAIVDIVETGTTLKENDLEIVEVVAEVSTLFVANRSAYKLRAREIQPLVERLRAAVG